MILPDRVCILALGGNTGPVRETFDSALHELEDAGFHILRRSGVLSTAPVGCEPGAPDFCNAAVSGIWNGTPEQLLDLCQTIEVRHGRPAAHPHWHSRTLDIDIILMGERRIASPRLTVPHPLAATRDFVLTPLRQIAPEAVADLLKQPQNLSERAFQELPLTAPEA